MIYRKGQLALIATLIFHTVADFANMFPDQYSTTDPCGYVVLCGTVPLHPEKDMEWGAPSHELAHQDLYINLMFVYSTLANVDAAGSKCI